MWRVPAFASGGQSIVGPVASSSTSTETAVVAIGSDVEMLSGFKKEACISLIVDIASVVNKPGVADSSRRLWIFSDTPRGHVAHACSVIGGVSVLFVVASRYDSGLAFTRRRSVQAGFFACRQRDRSDGS